MNYEFDFSFLAEYWPMLVKGAVLTAQLSILATILGFLVGTLCAVASTGRSWIASAIVGAYVEIIRNTPLLVQLFVVFFGLSSLGLKLSATTSAVIGLTINIGAYSSEIIRAGITSINRGQVEAADCLALTRWQVMMTVILPSAIEKVYPALTSQYVLLMLGTSIASQISSEELTAAASRIQSDTFRSFEVFIVVAALYLALSFLMRGLFWLVGQFAFPRRRRLGTSL
ncbi:amino acid ABC transporter permease [Microvirga lotononidis]|uniref:Amine acid ABC transporter, permease protein, 3-TM region, His/Glu/Gln/Arg/opine family n=1 Tax=Microvirga lotononidis TaxID=864069 RepID=I4Z133_9HYPH|nr:amino acid ABC transporter permease [Microvirga lotononidis]EIM29925.1 amine acid ABC transporter, permease protein, 3-TM region, His/Glu/Gln/Arg/opine family [Microvirga lotononidis]WQO32013.1 amino acid ABC transporter permease [Microvirga lotononidis]